MEIEIFLEIMYGKLHARGIKKVARFVGKKLQISGRGGWVVKAADS